jgi:hypothetical protein
MLGVYLLYYVAYFTTNFSEGITLDLSPNIRHSQLMCGQ